MSNDDRMFVRFKGRTIGPLARDEIRNLIRRGQVSMMHELSSDGVTWRPAQDFRELFPNSSRPKSESDSSGGDLQLQRDPRAQKEAAPTIADRGWYAHVDGSNQGPIEESQLKQWISNGRIDGGTLIWREGMADWLALELVHPDWLKKSNSSGKSVAHSEPKQDRADVSELASKILSANGWVYFIATLGIAVSATQIILWFALFLMAVARRTGGTAQEAQIVFSLTNVAFSIAALVASIHLLRYANAVGILRFQPSDETLILVMQRLSMFWKFAGILLLIALSIFLFLLLLAYALGLGIGQSFSPTT